MPPPAAKALRIHVDIDDELFFAAKLAERGAIEGQHLDIVAADDQQGWGAVMDGDSRWQAPALIAVFKLADQYLMLSVTWAPSPPTAKAASMNRGRLITARMPFDSA
jgi:hypothetical protein